jgi:Tfp pilus assembly protein PilE
MFDLRYHVASLTAVFVALVIGILVGVAISSHTNFDRKLLEQQKADLQHQLDNQTALANQLAQSQRAAIALSQASYPLVMADRLRGKRIGMVFVGPVDSRVRNLVQRMLDEANALPSARMRVLKVPVDMVALAALIDPRPALAKVADPSKPDAVGRELGLELVKGGEMPLWKALSGQLIAEQSGNAKLPLDGVVLVRTVASQQGPTARFLRGFYNGLGASAKLVGAEQSGQTNSALAMFRRNGISSVDDLELPVGRLALAALLAGAQSGHYGLAPEDSAVLPAIPPVVAPGG